MLKKFFLLSILFLNVAFAKQETILVSLAPYRFFVEQIAGDDFRVETIVPSATNPHAFEPTPSQMKQMGKASIWFRIGEPFETKLVSVLQRRGLVVSDLRKGIDLMGSLCCEKADRHIWLSPSRVKEQVSLIEHVLSKQYPAKKALFQENSEILCKKLDALDEDIRHLLKSKKQTILVSHPAFGYFCSDYKLEQLSVEQEGKEPKPKYLEAILEKAISQNVKIAFELPQYNNKGTQMIAKKLHLALHSVDPYSADYFDTMKQLAQCLHDRN